MCETPNRPAAERKSLIVFRLVSLSLDAVYGYIRSRKS